MNNNFQIKLPITNEDGCYEIRMESIGGLGANLCGKLLGELGAKYLGFNSSSFSSYGSEKRGSPVKSYVRWCPSEQEIFHNSPVEHPHLLLLFHHALTKTLPVTSGADENCTLVINTKNTPEKERDELKLYAGTICCIDALSLALESKSRVNMVMLGAAVKASGFIPLDAVKALVSDTLGKKYPTELERNLNGLDLGYRSIKIQSFAPDNKYDYIPYRETQGKLGYANAPIGGMNPHFGNSVSNDLSASREGYIPLYLPDNCIHCGLCDSTCPDMVFQFTPGEYRGKSAMINRGLDYHHCKGCLRCVNICPTKALIAGKEEEHENPKHFVRNKDLIVPELKFESAGANPYVTGEAYLDEKRVDGGLM